MSIIVNGGSDPRHIIYNGTYLAEVVFDSTTVWESFPANLDSFTVTYRNTLTLAYSNVVRTGTNIPAVGSTVQHVSYSGDISGTISESRTLYPSSGKISFVLYDSISIQGMHSRLTYVGEARFSTTIQMYSAHDSRYFNADFTVAPEESYPLRNRFTLVGTLSDYGITPNAVITLNPTSFQASSCAFKIGARTWIN